MRRLAGAAALACAGLMPGGAFAGDAARWYLQVDNDVIAAGDRWYTSGVRIARVAGAGAELTEWGLLQEIYTPEAERWAPGVDDRAPTARLLGYRAWHRVGPGAIDTFELGAGVRGPSALGEESTDAIHKWVPAPYVDWTRQDGDRLDAYAAATRSHALSAFHVHYGAVAGNQVAFAHGGVEWRFGRDPGRVFSPALRYVATPPPAAGDFSWSAFVGAGARAVARNAMLRRNYDAFGPEISPRRAIGRLATGVACVTPWGTLTASAIWDTREFAEQRQAHAYGAFTVHVEF